MIGQNSIVHQHLEDFKQVTLPRPPHGIPADPTYSI